MIRACQTRCCSTKSSRCANLLNILHSTESSESTRKQLEGLILLDQSIVMSNNSVNNNDDNSIVSSQTLVLSQVEREDIEEAFAMFDDDNDGLIVVSELRQALQSVVDKSSSSHSSLQKIQLALRKMPENNKINKDEFTALITKPDPHDDRSEIQKVFDLFDADEKGYIAVSDLKRIAKELGECLEEEELEEMIQRASDSGKVTIEDFENIMTRKLFN